MATVEGTKGSKYFNVAGAADGEGVATKGGTISSQYYNMASATYAEGMAIEEGPIVSQSTWQVQPTANSWLLRKERSLHDFSNVARARYEFSIVYKLWVFYL